MTTQTITSLLSQYEAGLAPARQAMANLPALQVLLEPGVKPRTLAAFLVYFNALGVGMTEPVDSWVFRAGEASIKLGYKEMGEALQLHAKHEAGHHLMMIEDTKALVDFWNKFYQPILNADELLSLPETQGVTGYFQLHEDVIVGDNPFAQIAIELEIERLSLTVGPLLIAKVKEVLGTEILEGLSFLEEHIAIDVSHTHFNEKQLSKFLGEYPQNLDVLIKTGSEALEAYSQFLTDCVELAVAL